MRPSFLTDKIELYPWCVFSCGFRISPASAAFLHGLCGTKRQDSFFVLLCIPGMPEYECISPRPFMPCCSSFSDLTHWAERERQRVGEKQRGKRERFFWWHCNIQAVAICFHSVLIVLKCKSSGGHTVWAWSLMLQAILDRQSRRWVSQWVLYSSVFQRQ